MCSVCLYLFFFFKQKTAYEMRISDWSSDVCSSDLPVAMGYIPLGMVFGFLFVQAGATAWLAILASILVYAGAAQYMMIPMMAAGLPISAIALSTLIINLRSEEHTSELQSLMRISYAVFCLKKKKTETN